MKQLIVIIFSPKNRIIVYLPTPIYKKINCRLEVFYFKVYNKFWLIIGLSPSFFAYKSHDYFIKKQF